MPNPILPKSKTDPVGGSKIVNKAFKEIELRYAGALEEILAAFNAIPLYALNEAEVAYGLTAAQRSDLSDTVQAILERWLIDGRTEDSFFYATFDEQALQTGTAKAVANISALSPAYASSETLAAIIRSPAYQNIISTAKFKSYEHWTGATAQTKSDLMQIITQSVADGKNPKVVAREIEARMGVSRSKAQQYAQTDITDALRQATMNEDRRAQEKYKLNTGLLWSSAFLPTTRHWHASRSGQTYTIDQVQAFYGERGNKYGCHCSVTTVLLDDNGKPMLTERVQAAMLEEKRQWQEENVK